MFLGMVWILRSSIRQVEEMRKIYDLVGWKFWCLNNFSFPIFFINLLFLTKFPIRFRTFYLFFFFYFNSFQLLEVYHYNIEKMFA